MSAAERPWWASGDAGDGLLDEDPLTAHRAGRAGEAHRAGRGGGQQQREHVDACGVCPVCTGIRVLGEVRPEIVGHLAEAARHLTLAAKAFIDAQAEGLRRDEGLQRIDLDEE